MFHSANFSPAWWDRDASLWPGTAGICSKGGVAAEMRGSALVPENGASEVASALIYLCCPQPADVPANLCFESSVPL